MEKPDWRPTSAGGRGRFRSRWRSGCHRKWKSGIRVARDLLTNFPVFERFSRADRRSLMAVFKPEIRSFNHAGGPHDHGGTEETEVTEFFSRNQRPPAKQAEQRSSVSSVSSVPQWFTKHACCRMSVFGFSGKMGAPDRMSPDFRPRPAQVGPVVVRPAAVRAPVVRANEWRMPGLPGNRSIHPPFAITTGGCGGFRGRPVGSGGLPITHAARNLPISAGDTFPVPAFYD